MLMQYMHFLNNEFDADVDVESCLEEQEEDGWGAVLGQKVIRSDGEPTGMLLLLLLVDVLVDGLMATNAPLEGTD